ncbi:prepilin peptidase [Clostridiisalibacter paucivorans]|uniref:prepilin peptidase n=1 Tax=Clostridiisalibacter paucivorans TaxID=408753 RepID=UPI00047B66BE|nr:A24 family peptidase [Clostridiisalibacter paucivorans]
MDLIIIKGCLFTGLFIIAGYVDIKTRTIPDWIHVLIILTGLIKINPLESLLGLSIVPLPFFIMACLKENSIGGGDVKLVGACGFFLGVKGGIAGSIIGLVIAVVVEGVYYLIKNKDRSMGFALAPYIGMGYMLVYIVESTML